MTPSLVGYFPKRTEVPAEWNAAPNVAECCSVSACLAPAPDGWIDRWLHNDLGFYDDPKTARSVAGGSSEVSVFAYRLLPENLCTVKLYHSQSPPSRLCLFRLRSNPWVGMCEQERLSLLSALPCRAATWRQKFRSTGIASSILSRAPRFLPNTHPALSRSLALTSSWRSSVNSRPPNPLAAAARTRSRAAEPPTVRRSGSRCRDIAAQGGWREL